MVILFLFVDCFWDGDLSMRPAFFSLISFSIFTAVDDVCGWGNLASKPYVHFKPKFLLQALLGTPFCSFELFRRWQLWKCPWSAELGSILFLLLGREKERGKGYQESTETEPKNQEIEVGFVIIFRVSYYCRAFHLPMWIFSLDQALRVTLQPTSHWYKAHELMVLSHKFDVWTSWTLVCWVCVMTQI